MAQKTLSISRLRLTDNVSLAKTDRLKCETTLFKDGSDPMIFDPKCFKAAVRSSLDKIWRRCFEERIVEVCYRGLNLQMHTLFAVGPHYKNNTECFHNGLVRELKEKQRKLSRHSMTSKTHGPHRRNNKSEYQECTCKMDKSLNRGMFNKFESRKICVAALRNTTSCL